MKIKSVFILGALLCTTSAMLADSAPVITTQPKSHTVNEGDAVTFSVEAKSVSEGYPEGENFTTLISSSVNLDMVWCPPGTFMMGSPKDELGRNGNGTQLEKETQHEVTLTKGYWLGKYEVTQAQYEAIMGENPSGFKGTNFPVELFPVEWVRWCDATNFCAKLTAQERAAGRLPAGYEYTLPTEAQWEYACRAGTTTALNSGKDLSNALRCPEMDEVGWYVSNCDKKTHPVGQKKPNAWGLYDMHGNVSELCLDWTGGDYPTSSVTDPYVIEGEGRALRGGSYIASAHSCRSADRGAVGFNQGSNPSRGFRVALVLVEAQASAEADTLTYQWKKDGKAIGGATDSSYIISSAKKSDEGSYTVTVSNSAGSVTSETAKLTVNAVVVKPTITTQPKSQTVTEGDPVTFIVGATSGSEINEDKVVPLSSSVNLDMVWIEPGSFTMGSPDGELGRRDNETLHQVAITEGYWLGKYEVTQEQYQTVMESNPSKFNGNRLPVEKVTWANAMEFCARLTEQEKAAGRLPAGYEYTLPTEAQWEYACRAGTTTELNSGKNLTSEENCPNMDQVGWYVSNSDSTTKIVGQKQPNAWGLYDMHGNVWEWCLDWKGDYSLSAVIDPVGPNEGIYKTLRGGSWNYTAGYCRSAIRGSIEPTKSNSYTGFRVALSAAEKGKDLVYQWYKDGKAISGATSASYTISSVTSSDAGSYTVTVSNSAGSVTSSAAVLTVNDDDVMPKITSQPKSQEVTEGDSVTFSVKAEGGHVDSGTPVSSDVILDLCLLIDSTGSMGDSISAVKTSAINIVREALGKSLNNRVSVVDYRDFPFSPYGDPGDYVYKVRTSFTTNSSSIISAINSINVGGGNDNPEAAFSATAGCINGGALGGWRKDAKRVIMIMTDAPPHEPEPETEYTRYSIISMLRAGGDPLSGVDSSDETLSGPISLWPILVGSIGTSSKGEVYHEIADATSGKVFTVSSGSEVVDALLEIIHESITPSLTYQWYKDGEAISGATESSYTISSVKLSDAGNYTVKVCNSMGCVMSDVATLTVKKLVPDATAIRSISIDGLTATVKLKLIPNELVNVYFVEETVPAIGTIIPNDGGVYTAAKDIIRWPFLDGIAREVSYTVTVPSDYNDKAIVNGIVSFDTNVRVITGDNELDFTIKTHPADMNDDFEITTSEVSLYAVAWKLGQNWSREPVDIPMSYISRAAVIWGNGGDYIYDSSKAKPACWVNTVAKAASVELASASINERKISMVDGKASVEIEIVPREGISVYFVEEQLPADIPLNIASISEGGNYIQEKNVIRWSFLDGKARTLAYILEPDTGFQSTIITLNGEVMFDEETFTIEGDTEANFGTEPVQPAINFVVEDDGETLVLDFEGILYESDDAINWRIVEGAKAPFKVDTSKGKKFYRCVQ